MILRLAFRLLCIALGVVLGAFALGCNAVAGTDDVELTYEPLAPDPTKSAEHGAARAETAKFGEDTRALVIRRLGAAQIGADVSEEGRFVRIVVDERLAGAVDELVTWTGTLVLYETDASATLSARDEDHHLTLETTTDDAGREERYWVGSQRDIARAVTEWATPKEHRVFVEPLWTSAHGTSELLWRTRVVHAQPIGEIADGAVVGWGSGGTLRVRAQDGATAGRVLGEARARKGAIVVARGRVSLGAPVLGEDAILFKLGAGVASYNRAQTEMRLLATPRLPPLRRSGAVGLPPNNLLGVACIIVPILLSLGWLFFVRRFDRAHPEPMWLVALTFVLGALVTLPAGYAEYALAKLSPWLDPRLVTFGGRAFALPLSFLVMTVVVGLVEEGAKRLAVVFATRRAEFDEPVDGIIYGIVASLGFAAAENVRYFAIGRLAPPLVIARCFMSVPAHMFFGAIWGYALGARLVDPRKRTWAWLLVAAAAHGLFDALLGTDGAGLLAVVLELGLASLFVALVQKTLRHGIVVPEMLAIRPEDRLLVRVGRPQAFWISAIVLHVLAFGIFMLGAWYQLARHRPSWIFVGGSSAMVALLAVAALGIARSLPLDVAIDAYGVTFAGAARPWRKIRGFAAKADHVELDCEAGPLHLGPADPETIAALADGLRNHLGTVGTERLSTLESRR